MKPLHDNRDNTDIQQTVDVFKTLGEYFCPQKKRTMKTNIEYRGIDFHVEWEHTPGEDMTYDYPGCPEEAEIIRIMHKQTDFTQFFTDRDIEEITKILLQ